MKSGGNDKVVNADDSGGGDAASDPDADSFSDATHFLMPLIFWMPHC